MPDNETVNPNANGAPGANGDASGDAKGTWSPPYISFTNLLHLLDKVDNGNLPPRIDRTFLTGSNAVNTMTLAALRSLDLIDGEGRPQPMLMALSERPGERKQLLREVIQRCYPKPVELGGQRATQGQLEEAFAEWGVTGDTRRKAIAFYLKAARFAEIPISPNFRTPSISRSDGAPRRNGNGRKKRAAPATAHQESGATAPDATPKTAADSSRIAELRTRYIEMLVTKVDAAEELDTGLLDRIENLLGFGTAEGEE